MLLAFEIKNNYSFKDSNILDLRKTNYHKEKYENHTFNINGCEILRHNILYGGNGYGKSNLIKSMINFKDFVLAQFNNTVNYTIQTKPHYLNIDKEMCFNICFIYENNRYLYECVVFKDNIIEEHLNVNDTDIYYRKNDTLKFNNKDIKVFENNLGFTKLLFDYNDNKELKEKLLGMKKFLSSIKLVNFEDNYIKKDVLKMLENKQVYEEFLKHIKIINFDDIYINKKYVQYNDIYLCKNNKLTDMDILPKSIQKFIYLLVMICDLKINKNILFIDDFSEKLHTNLSEYLIKVFQSFFNSSQLILSSHDIGLMNTNLFRLDEIAIIDKNEDEESTICYLSDFKNIEDYYSYYKAYLRGRFGGIH